MLIDNFGRKINYVRISVTDRCDLRCIYCIPKGYKNFLQQNNWLSFAQITKVAQAFAELGVKYFRLTGGEPLLRKNLADLASNLSSINGVDEISITTNGTQLQHYAQALFNAGVKRINVSLDSLRSDCVQQICGFDSLNKVLEGLEVAKKVGFSKIKINMVVLPQYNLADIAQMMEFCRANHFVLCLIETMPLGITGQNSEHVNLLDVIKQLQSKFKLMPATNIIGNGPARYLQNLDQSLTVGLITPMSQHFCATCNRVRLTADGVLYMCLGQNHSFDLKRVLKAGCSINELKQAIKDAIKLKPKEHNFLTDPLRIKRIMAKTGG